MIKVAFCDDDKKYADGMKMLLDEYSIARKKEIDTDFFLSSLELMAEVVKGSRYDVLIMDVIMPGENGISLAKEIRQYDSNVKIVFITNSPEYAIESYTVGAFYYYVKPIDKEKLFSILDNALDLCEREKHRSIIVKCKNGIKRIDLDQLVSCEVNRRTIVFRMENGREFEHNGSMDNLCTQLAQYENFMRPHRAYLINMEHIDMITGKSILMMDGSEIPIPHGKYTEIKERYLKYVFSNNQIII